MRREQMTEYMKNQMEVCTRILERYREEGEVFLKRVRWNVGSPFLTSE